MLLISQLFSTLVFAAPFALIAILIGSPPSPIDPLPFRADSPPKLQPGGPYRPNERLREVEKIGVGKLNGPEDVLAGGNGVFYFGCEDGWIRSLKRGGGSDGEDLVEEIVDTGGRPLGLEWVADGKEMAACVPGKVCR